MRFLTDFADQAVMLPMAASVALALALLGCWRGLAAWLAAVGAMLLLILGLKAACVLLAPEGTVPFSPSGHVAAACVLYGGSGMLLLRRAVPMRLLVLLPLCIAGLVGTTRIALHAHDLREVLAGSVVGVADAMLLPRLSGPLPRAATLPLLLAMLIPVLLFHGSHLPIEAAIRSTARAARASG